MPGPGVLERALSILSALRNESAPLGLAELARRSGLPKATTFRLANQLVDLHLLERRGPSYALGSKLFELGTGTRGQALRDIAITYLEDLYEAVHETIHLGVLDGTEVLYMEKLAGRRKCAVSTANGARRPLYCTALGKAILAFSPPSVLQQVVADGLTRYTPYTIVAPGLLYRELERIRETGLAIDREESELGITCVASPLLDRNGVGRGAISVTGPVHRLQPKYVSAAVRAAAMGVTRSWLASSAQVPPIG